MQSNSLAKLNKEGGQEFVNALSFALAFTLKQINVQNGISAMQISLAIPQLLRQFYYLKFDEVVLCFREAARGRWGTNYNRLDLQVITSWLTAYDEQVRTPLVNAQATHEHEQLKSGKNIINQLTTAELVQLGYQPLNDFTRQQVAQEQQQREAELAKVAAMPDDMREVAKELSQRGKAFKVEQARSIDAATKRLGQMNEVGYAQQVRELIPRLSEAQLKQMEDEAWETRNKAALDAISEYRRGQSAAA
ncbi:hypothetical protein [Hymenobacter wooponensis]|uniref:Uncharacterized protein n=1 Tax=Hymenobacter wooponensis TaxID=1525360 RepID=A0A4Z0MTT1_9BACT|nr:hypothetical protein [Hymenobacter wooponensis]TGD82850.1 hypothetical protein EU557_03460 [Hymenobacter wooponensis]